MRMVVILHSCMIYHLILSLHNTPKAKVLYAWFVCKCVCVCVCVCGLACSALRKAIHQTHVATPG